MDAQEIQRIVEKAIDQRFCCNASDECEAGFCRVRLDRIESKLDLIIKGTSTSLNSIIDFLKKDKRHD